MVACLSINYDRIECMPDLLPLTAARYDSAIAIITYILLFLKVTCFCPTLLTAYTLASHVCSTARLSGQETWSALSVHKPTRSDSGPLLFNQLTCILLTVERLSSTLHSVRPSCFAFTAGLLSVNRAGSARAIHHVYQVGKYGIKQQQSNLHE